MSIKDSSGLPSSQTSAERRTQRRVSVEIPASLAVRGLSAPLTAVTKDLSWGGTLLCLFRPLPPGTNTVRIILPWKPEERITALAYVLRVKRLQDGHFLVATRFLSLSPRSHARLERLLEALSATTAPLEHSGPREWVKELEVNVNDLHELRHMMESIASGRYTTTVFEAYTPHQSLCFVLAGTDAWAGIRLRARVTDVKPTTLPGFAGVPLYSVTLQFEHPKEALSNLIHHLLGQIPEQGDLSSLLEWSQMLPSQLAREPSPAKPPKPSPSKPSPSLSPLDIRPLRGTLRSALEADFPEALNYLMLGWGDPQAFEMLFRELTMGERFNFGGWPAAAWEELTLLQEVHDRAYGLPQARGTFNGPAGR